jgi:sec-independent protein translocase protein TatA
MFQGLTGWHLLVVLAVILLLFGAAKLPALAKSMGQSARVFKSEMKEMKRDDEISPSPAEAPRPTDAGTTPTVAPEPRRSNDPTV